MMKRNILAIVIPALLAAGAANAAEIYNKDGNKLDLYGKVDARHTFSDNTGDDGDQTYVRFGFKGETKINDQLTGYGQWEYNVQADHAESAGTEGNKTRLGCAGLKFGDWGSFDYGRNYGVIYDVMSYTDQLPIFGDDTMYQTNDNFMVGRSNGLATYRNSNFFGLVDGLSFALQYQGKNENDRNTEIGGSVPNSSIITQNGDGVGTSVAYALGNSGVSLTGAYANSNRTVDQKTQANSANGNKAEQYAFGAKYDANNLYLATFYGESRNTTAYGGDNQVANKTQNFEVVAQYQFDFGLRPSIAYLQSKGKDLNGVTNSSTGATYGGGDADLVKYIEVGTYYYFNKNMSTYVDYKINLLDDNDYTKAAGASTDNVVGVGLQYQF